MLDMKSSLRMVVIVGDSCRSVIRSGLLFYPSLTYQDTRIAREDCVIERCLHPIVSAVQAAAIVCAVGGDRHMVQIGDESACRGLMSNGKPHTTSLPKCMVSRNRAIGSVESAGVLRTGPHASAIALRRRIVGDRGVGQLKQIPVFGRCLWPRCGG